MEKYVSNEPTFSLGKNHNRQGCACRSWKKKKMKHWKNQPKIDQKLKPKMDGFLASVFNGFWWVLGCKLVPKIALKSISRGIKKGMPKSKHLRSDLWASWEVSRRPWGRGIHGGRRVSGPLRSFRGKQVSVGKEEVKQKIRNAVRARRGGGFFFGF